jgi:YebC/PmpR family DNA-binding regulatory protein
MSGHSKWSKIKRTKGAKDQARGKVFTKLGSAIRLAIDKARAANMPKDTIAKALARGDSSGDGPALESALYEAYGSGGVAFIIEVVTDNTNRSVGDIKNALTKNGGRLADPKSVLWMFEHKAVIAFEGTLDNEKELALIDAGAEDIVKEDGGVVITGPTTAFDRIQSTLTRSGIPLTHADLAWMAKDPVTIDEKTEMQITRLTDALDDLDDVQSISTNIA